jgi:hypothetical protein
MFQQKSTYKPIHIDAGVLGIAEIVKVMANRTRGHWHTDPKLNLLLVRVRADSVFI